MLSLESLLILQLIERIEELEALPEDGLDPEVLDAREDLLADLKEELEIKKGDACVG